ncbi:MAG TPA: YbhB/YbcL family Raf kinase inhibitor-like protein [Gammaproteobacteria bacterium]|nr:YbhB/YbcL family Raf kinase inhibitor-like protein [Gammaproteobacteria bacterium]
MKSTKGGAAAALVILAFLAGAPAFAQGGGGGPPRFSPLLMESTAFEDGGIVPQKYAGREGVQPGFTFSNAPDTTVSYAIIFHDLDVALQGGTNDVLHWLIWNIPAAAKGIPEGSLPAGSVTGRNIAGQNSYFGPGAPPGPRYHHYVFELYALSANLDLPSTAGRDELLAAMAGKIVAKAAYVGRYRSTPPPQ